MKQYPTRRRFVQLFGASSVAALAGCSGSDGNGYDSDSPFQTDEPNSTEAPTEPGQSESPIFEQTGKMTASDGDPGDLLGWSVSVSASGGTAVVSAFHDDDPNGTESGSVYVFTRSSGSWAQQAKLTADDGRVADRFGSSVSITDDGTTALIGAHANRNPDGERSGTVYVFSKSGDSWNQQTKLVANDSEDDDAFGSAVSIAGDGSIAVVGASNASSSDNDGAGSTYMFTRSGDSWSQQAKLQPEDVSNFGDSVGTSSDGTTAIIGANSDTNANGVNAGSVFVFSRSGDSWTQQAKLTADDGEAWEEFGGVVEMTDNGTKAIVTIPSDTTPNGERSGSAYIFSRTNGSWEQEAKLIPDDGGQGEEFGSAAGISGDGTTAIVGTSLQAEFTGAAYVYTDATDGWSQQAKLTPDNAGEDDKFGTSIGISSDGTTAVISADGESEPNGDDSGAAYAFESPQ
ncbi:FG-GAP repeat protein [Halorientalis marina]|uniref:FG-GAP repeat protein n=1 Tax=Halorientalis marina TaxID=2931976 RepID=UPI002112BE6A|nr:FG-GAP repeat protein [Halorientalis marina]